MTNRLSIRLDKERQRQAFADHATLFRELSATEHYMSESVAAQFIGYTPRGLQAMRLSGRGPRHVTRGRRIMYSRASLVAWLQAGEKARA